VRRIALDTRYSSQLPSFMILSSSIQSTLLRYQSTLDAALHAALDHVQAESDIHELNVYYGQMRYHLGWVDATLAPTHSNPGKLLRPTLLLLAYEAAGAWELASEIPHDTLYLERALPAAAAVELTHNFTLVHDDIEDGDIERRHRPTLWRLWGVPQAINTGDGLFALARYTLWGVLEKGVEGSIAARLAAILDRNVLTISEGQYLDISFEQRQDISVSMYLDMIQRKTAALMGCAAEMGAILGTRDKETIARLSSFGQAIGTAFQVRDDILGVWASTAELGKTPAGDVYRRKKSLPILHSLEHANAEDKQTLQALYQQEATMNAEQVERVLAIFERTQTRIFCRSFLAQQCRTAREALSQVPHQNSQISIRAREELEAFVHFVETTAH
jgi:geranylgeranyl diphosphate synthase type I